MGTLLIINAISSVAFKLYNSILLAKNCTSKN